MTGNADHVTDQRKLIAALRIQNWLKPVQFANRIWTESDEVVEFTEELEQEDLARNALILDEAEEESGSLSRRDPPRKRQKNERSDILFLHVGPFALII